MIVTNMIFWLDKRLKQFKFHLPDFIVTLSWLGSQVLSLWKYNIVYLII